MPRKPRPLINRITALAFACLTSAATLIGSPVLPASADTASVVVPAPDKQITASSVGIQMFMWPWVSLAGECTSQLGPQGVDWILVSPPQEDIQGSQWWTHYQPVSYKLQSQLGTEAQFAAMVSACNTAGVSVIVDAVINHMAATATSGFAGTLHEKYSYPGIYASTDFHAGLNPKDPNFCDHSIANYYDTAEVTNCELGGLADLATEKPSVRGSISGYLNHLIDLGVSGFRIDAAKHMAMPDLVAIKAALKPVNGRSPYLLSESIGSAALNEPYTALGDVFAWDYQQGLYQMFNGQAWRAADPKQTAVSVGPAANTVIMVSNHDTEHHGPTAVTYREPQKFLAANAYLLAVPFGKPMLYTGYAFNNATPDVGPSAAADGTVAPAVCPAGPAALTPQKSYASGTFICLDRWTAIGGMIGWRHQVADAPIANFYVRQNTFAFSRGSGFFALNASATNTKKASSLQTQTGLPAGVYCDVISGGASAVKAGKCAGKSVTVGADGRAKLSLPPMTAMALDAANKLR